jgi:hypothetical protein
MITFVNILRGAICGRFTEQRVILIGGAITYAGRSA